MAKSKKNTPRINRKAAVGVAVALIVGLPVVILATQQTTNLQQHASQFNDINTSFAISQTNNADETMGPATAADNFSATFPALYLGKLDFKITDPPQVKENATRTGNPFFQATPSPTHIIPTQAQNNDSQGQNTDKPPVTPPNGQTNAVTPESSNQGGPQAVSSLLITIKKAEVHLAQVGLPGTKNEDITPHPSPTPVHGKPSETNTQTSNQTVDKWETLAIGSPQTLDLVQLAKTHDFSSLGITNLVNGRYTEIRLYISTASATLQNGTKVQLVIPGKENIVRVVQTFVIDSGKTTNLSMYFDAQNSVIKAGDQYILKPVVANLRETDGE